MAVIGNIVRMACSCFCNAKERGCRRLKAPRVINTWFARELRLITGVLSRYRQQRAVNRSITWPWTEFGWYRGRMSFVPIGMKGFFISMWYFADNVGAIHESPTRGLSINGGRFVNRPYETN